MKNISQFLRTFTAVLVIFNTGLFYNLFAQKEQTSQVTAIPGTQILSKSEDVSEFLAEITAEISDTEKYSAMISKLPDYQKLITELKKSPEMQNLAQSSGAPRS